MLQIKQELDADGQRAAEFNTEDDELAFYGALAANFANVYEPGFLRDVVHDVVQTIKRQLKVDWAEPHRDSVRAEIRAAVKRVLRRKDGIRDEDIETILQRLIEQAEASFRDWPLAV